MSDGNDMSLTPTGTGRFTTTHWSVVLAAGTPDSSHYREALETLCRTYWFPLYAYLRRQGHNAHQAEDYTQAFFAQILEKNYLCDIKRKPAKFRSFLLMALKRFIADQQCRARAVKRGSGQKMLSLNFEDAEGRYALEPASELSPEKVFDKSWVLTLLEQTITRLETELAGMNKQKLFEILKVYLAGKDVSIPYRDLAVKLDMTEGAVKAAVYRLRRRYREILRDEIAQTVTTGNQIDDEIRGLFATLAE